MIATDRPYPPTDIDTRDPRVDTIQHVPLHRFYSRRQNPIFFDRSTQGRFNSPNGSFGVLYAAQQKTGAFAETFLRSAGSRLLPADYIEKKGLVLLRSTQTLRVVKLYGPGLAVLGATAEVTASAPPYDLPQAWAAALHSHPGIFDGIAYHARHDDSEICYALFDRSAPAIEEVDRRDNLLEHDWFYNLFKHYSVGLAPE